MTSKLKKAIAAVKDQTSISLAKVSKSNSSNLEVAILKATTHDDVPMDERYVNEVLKLISSNKIHAAACARAIGKRIGRTHSWIVAIKSLMLVLRIFQDGDPYFPREVLHAMKRGAKILNLSSFRDDSNSHPWDFTSFVRTFALYLNERLDCFLTGKLQRRYTYDAKESPIYQRSQSRIIRPNEPACDVKPAMLLDKISYWQLLLERSIATRPTGAAKMNRLVQISLYAIVQESFELYKDISDGLTLILDSFYHLQFQHCVSAFELCVKATKQFRELSDFYSLCKSINVGRSSEYPTVQTISEELVEALQEFLKDRSSFQSNAKPTNRFPLPPSPPLRVEPRLGPQGNRRQQAASPNTTDGLLEDLIEATETTTCPAISIDLEAYPASQQDDSFRVSDARSTRSLPVSNTMMDLIAACDWSEQQDKEQQENQHEPKQVGSMDSSAAKNWELVLAETLSSSASLQSIPEDNTNPCPDQTPWLEENHSSSSSNSRDLVLLEPANYHYNPFLQNPIQSPDTSSPPTFHAIPSSPVQNPNQTLFAAQNENDPFASPSEHWLSRTVDQQHLLHEQQVWLTNQHKIIAKHMT
ncbi:clathrin coat assembly protein AP180 [Sesamum indicum]|uniref:Clathrin coat assembly protein AP180 n=1 Tax=Sesamum indicum TaxID=4182 RepID=A0A6I9TP67_SESIN|nr:clathrin coat assembly protein AP180 [Sesamum indicum]